MRLGKISSPAARLIVLENLKTMPQETATFVRYLFSIKEIESQDVFVN